MLASYPKKVVLLGVSLLSAATLLQGCPLVVLGAAGGGTLMASQRRTFGTQTEDREIQIKASTKIAQALQGKAGVHINVAVFNRRVLLTGEIPDAATGQKALEAMRPVINVQSIMNELKVQPASELMSRSNDTYLTAKVKTALVKTSNLSANYFKVVTERGIVYLMGLVTQEEASQAADIVSRISGVTQVVKVFEYLTPEQKKALTPVIDTTGNASVPSTRRASPISSIAPAADTKANTVTPRSTAASVHPISTTPVNTSPIDKKSSSSNSTPR